MKRKLPKKTASVVLAAALSAAMIPTIAISAGCSSASDTGSNTQQEQTQSADNSSDSNAQSGDSGSSDNSTASSDNAQQGDGQAPPSNSDGTPPEKPDGDQSSEGGQGQQDGQTPPEKPDGDNGEAPSGEPPSGEAPNGEAPSGQGSGGANTQSFDYSGSYSGTLAADGKTQESIDESISSTDADKNAVIAQNGAQLTVSGASITKSGDDTNGDNCNFYGLNSSVTAVGENTLIKISDSAIASTAEGSNGIFATDNATVYANNCNISTTTGGNARGLDVTYGGTIIANAMTISTEKDHCAAVASDRGGGSVSVSNSTLSTAGAGSPLVYSTGDLELDNVTGTASGSQICGMEGKNVIRINGSTLESTNNAVSGSDPIKNGVIIYQSTSGDADTSASTQADFELSDSTLKSSITGGAMFYVTNTDANIVLQSSTLDFDSSKAELLHAAGNSSSAGWGTSGKNAGNATLTAIDQELSGNVYADSISEATVYLTDGSTWTGAVASENSTDDGTEAAPKNVTVNVDSSSTWVVSGDTTVGNLNVADGGKVVDSSGKTATIVNAKGKTLVKGSGSVTVTVSGDYGTSVDTSNAGSIQGASDTLKTARASFDGTFGTSTAWGENSSSSNTGSSVAAIDSANVPEATSNAESTSQNGGPGDGNGPGKDGEQGQSSDGGIGAWFSGVIDAIKSFFGA